MGLYQKYFKRMQDVLLSGLGLIILSPFFVLISFLIILKLGSPVIYKQARPGKDEIVFNLYKFRSMTNEKDSKGNFLPDSQRLTSFGKKLRRSSLDELPSLWNIFIGDMSIVGPRPLLVKYLPLYNEEQQLRHSVRPGLTGLAQISGRNNLKWEDKFKKDIEYVKDVTFLNDWKIIFSTIKKVLEKDGISSRGSVTMEEFKGN